MFKNRLDSCLDVINFDDKKLSFFTLTGKVIETKRTTRTSTKTTGGGGYIGKYGGQISNTRTTTNTVVEDTIWFLTENGDECKIHINDYDARKGETLSILYCGLQTKTSGMPATVINHSDGSIRNMSVLSALIKAKEITYSGNVVHGFISFILIPLTAIITAVNIASSHMPIVEGIFAAGGSIFFGSILFAIINPQKRQFKKFYAHVDRMSEKVLEEIKAINSEIKKEEANAAIIEVEDKPENSLVDEIGKLHQLKIGGVISDEEFASLKEKLITNA